MECVDGKSVWQLQQEKIPLPAIISEQVSKAVRLLHENKIVFGDFPTCGSPTFFTTNPRIMWFSLTSIGPGGMEDADILPRSTLATLGKRKFCHIVLCAKSMTFGKWNGW